MNDQKRKQAELDEQIDKAQGDKDVASQRLERIKDDKKLRLKFLLGKFQNLRVAYEYISNNRKEFRRKVWGPVGECSLSGVNISLS